MASSKHTAVPLIPISLEAVRQKVMEVVHLIERETKLFMERYLPNVGIVSAWPSLVEGICGRCGKHSAYLHDFKDLDNLMEKVKDDRLIIQHAQFSSLRRMTERARVFEYLAFSLRDNLNEAYEKYLKKYCKSFIGEIPIGIEIPCVRDHENKISYWENQVRERLELVDAVLDEIHRYENPFMKYVHHYEKMVQYMKETCNLMTLTCEPIRKWIAADALYARKVQHEINLLHRRKMELLDSTKQEEYDNDRLGVQLKRKVTDTESIEFRLKEARVVIEQLKSKELELTEQKSKVIFILSQKTKELVNTRSKIKNRKENTPFIFAYLTGASEILREDIRSYEFQFESIQFQINHLKKEQLTAQRKVDKIVQDLQNSFTVHEESAAKLRKQMQDVNKVKADVHYINSVIKTLKRIRDLKMNGNTVKKIYHSDYQLAPVITKRGKVDGQAYPDVSWSKGHSNKKSLQVPQISRSMDFWRFPAAGSKLFGEDNRYKHYTKRLQSQSLTFISRN